MSSSAVDQTVKQKTTGALKQGIVRQVNSINNREGYALDATSSSIINGKPLTK